MLDFVFKNLTSDKKYDSRFFEEILKAAVEVLGLEGRKSIGISLNLIGGGRIKQLNKKYCHKNKVTDVLSFPIEKNPLEKLRTTNYELRTLDLGDLFVCLPFAKKQAKRENISIERKLAQLTVHGFLHLAGYDHERTREDAGKMLELEDNILGQLNL